MANPKHAVLGERSHNENVGICKDGWAVKSVQVGELGAAKCFVTRTKTQDHWQTFIDGDHKMYAMLVPSGLW